MLNKTKNILSQKKKKELSDFRCFVGPALKTLMSTTTGVPSMKHM